MLGYFLRWMVSPVLSAVLSCLIYHFLFHLSALFLLGSGLLPLLYLLTPLNLVELDTDFVLIGTANSDACFLVSSIERIKFLIIWSMRTDANLPEGDGSHTMRYCICSLNSNAIFDMIWGFFQYAWDCLCLETLEEYVSGFEVMSW